ncbi:hypothetical protein ACS0TY_016122 [Phlomoides rotata]
MKKIIKKPHAIIFPYPLQGHVIPTVNLAITLASHGFTITFINTESIHHQISTATGVVGPDRDIFTESRKSGLDIRYATVSDGFPVGFDRSLHHDEFFAGFLDELAPYIDDKVGKLVGEDPTIDCIIVDTFFVWGSMIAKKYNLVYISFFTEPALVITLYYHVNLLKKNGHFASSTENRTDAIDYIPGVKSINPTDLTSYLQADDIHTPIHRIIERAFEDAKKADFVLCNTVQELEEETISALQKAQPFYAIGPILPSGRISMSLWAESECTQWLDSKPRDSVLYISFGSYAHTSKHVIGEIANGLVLSGVNFIWVLRPDIVSSDQPDILPVGFKERVGDRGLVVPWCCQIDVISHSSVGGFITHCGWNSILESVWCGVPMICYPLLTDQFTNRKLVVDDWKVGVNLCDGNSSISQEGVCEKMNYLMNSKEIRQETKKVRKILEDAMREEGSSVVNFNRFVEDLEAKIVEYNGFVMGGN